MKIAVVGATGIVGETFLDLIEERNFPVSEMRLFASKASEGREFRGCKLQVLRDGCFDGLDLVFFFFGQRNQRRVGAARGGGRCICDRQLLGFSHGPQSASDRARGE